MALRSRLLAAFLLAAAAFGCTCEDVVNTTPGILDVKPRVLDFQEVCLQDTSEQSISIGNVGNAPFDIVSVTLSPGAYQITGWMLPGDAERRAEMPATVEAGSEVVLIVGFTPTESNEYTQSLVIETNADNTSVNPNKVTVTLDGRGFTADPYVNPQAHRQFFRATCVNGGASTEGNFVPCAFLDFGKVLATEHSDRTVRLENAGCATVNVNEALLFIDPNAPEDEPESNVELFTFPNDKPPFKLRGGEHHDVVVRFTAPPTDEPPAVRLKFTSDDPNSRQAGWDPGAWELGLLSAPVIPALLVDPEVLTFFEGQAGVPLTKNITVRNTGSADLVIQSVTLAPDNNTTDYQLVLPNNESTFTLDPVGGANNERVLQVTFTSSGGSASGKVLVKTVAETREVKLIGGTEPILQVTWLDGSSELPPPINFGSVATGTKNLARTVIIANRGQAPLNLTAAGIVDDTGSSFALAGFAAGSLAPEATAQVTVTFNDNIHLTNDSAKLKIVSNDAVDAATGGERLVQILSTNAANLAPVPRIDFCGGIDPITTACQAAAPQVGVALWADGRGSRDPEGDPIKYRWSLTKPSASTARLVGPTGQPPTENDSYVQIISDAGAYPDVPSGVGAGNQYRIDLRVTDSYGNTDGIPRVVQIAGR